ncbi:hypothetical protein L0152_24600 [bacterium]|nr:hypothetical protein [bacterium]
MKFFQIFLLAALLACCCAGQKYNSFKTSTPLPKGHFLILGFQGGRDSWDDPKPGVARLAQKLRSLNLSYVHIETVENQKRDLAIMLIQNAFDFDGNRYLTEDERKNVRLIVYGMSFGGAAVVKLARQLDSENLPILLTVQIDSIGRNDAAIPSNVKRAANLFQRSGKVIHGEPDIRAEDPTHTQILGNFEYDYKNSSIDISNVSWIKKILRVAHTKMDRDPAVWSLVEQLIVEEITPE